LLRVTPPLIEFVQGIDLPFDLSSLNKNSCVLFTRYPMEGTMNDHEKNFGCRSMNALLRGRGPRALR
jgi:hypothetical protein